MISASKAESSKEARRSRRDFDGVSVFWFLMVEMLKRVQHDGRARFSGLPKTLFMIVTLDLFQGLYRNWDSFLINVYLYCRP